MVIQVEIYFVTSATLNGIWCIVTVSDLQQQQQRSIKGVENATEVINYRLLLAVKCQLQY